MNDRALLWVVAILILAFAVCIGFIINPDGAPLF
jgi:hypothetical protein